MILHQRDFLFELLIALVSGIDALKYGPLPDIPKRSAKLYYLGFIVFEIAKSFIDIKNRGFDNIVFLIPAYLNTFKL